MFGRDWMALAAGDEKEYNAMTVAWGTVGSLWNQYEEGKHGCFPVATVFVRPQRYTKKFMDSSLKFTLSWFGEGKYRQALGYLGSHSGKDEDKIKNAGLSPAFYDGTVYIAEARLALICRKLYQTEILQGAFKDSLIVDENYPLKDFHTMYIGEILKVLQAD